MSVASHEYYEKSAEKECDVSTTSAKDLFPSFRTVALLAVLGVIALLAIVPFLIAIVVATGSAAQSLGAEVVAASPIFGVTIPRGYRQWELVRTGRGRSPSKRASRRSGKQSCEQLLS
jgi:hypothetical protein